jgi:hypothetical protein
MTDIETIPKSPSVQLDLLLPSSARRSNPFLIINSNNLLSCSGFLGLWFPRFGTEGHIRGRKGMRNQLPLSQAGSANKQCLYNPNPTDHRCNAVAALKGRLHKCALRSLTLFALSRPHEATRTPSHCRVAAPHSLQTPPPVPHR